MPHPPKRPFWWMVKAGKDGEGSPHKKTAACKAPEVYGVFLKRKGRRTCPAYLLCLGVAGVGHDPTTSGL